MLHIDAAQEVDPPAGADMRSRAGQEAHVLAQIRAYGGFTIFWATDNQKRAHAIGRLENSGRIRRTHTGLYPWCPYKIVRKRK